VSKITQQPAIVPQRCSGARFRNLSRQRKSRQECCEGEFYLATFGLVARL